MKPGTVTEVKGPGDYRFFVLCSKQEWGGASCVVDAQHTKRFQLKFKPGTDGGDGGSDISSTLWIIYDLNKKTYELVLRTIAEASEDSYGGAVNEIKVQVITGSDDKLEDKSLSSAQLAKYKSQYWDVGHPSQR